MIKLASRRTPQPVRAPQLAGDEIVVPFDTEQAEAAHGEELSTSSRTPRHRRLRRRFAVGTAGTLMILATGGCAGVATSEPATGYWLVRVSGGYGNIYGYGVGERAPKTHDQYLCPTTADANRNAPAAAKRLGIAHVDPGIY